MKHIALGAAVGLLLLPLTARFVKCRDCAVPVVTPAVSASASLSPDGGASLVDALGVRK